MLVAEVFLTMPLSSAVWGTIGYSGLRDLSDWISGVLVPREDLLKIVEFLLDEEKIPGLYRVGRSLKPSHFLIEFRPYIPPRDSLSLKPRLEERGCEVLMGR